MKQSVKETLVVALQASGFDLITACEHAHAFLAELRERPPGVYTVLAGVKTITIHKA